VIKKLEIKNYQSHKKTEINLHPGVNAIVGPTDSGKSAILRALRWVLFNDQPGDAYRRHGSDRTEVSITIPEPTQLIDGAIGFARIRSNKENKYEMLHHGIGDSIFDKVGNEVPEEIAKAFNMDDINVQRQMDAPFLLSESPAEVGRVLNRAAGIDDIDACMSKINGMERENSSELKTRTRDLEGLDAELSRYRRLPDLDARLCAAEKVEKALRKAKGQADDVGAALGSLEVVEAEIKHLRPISEASVAGVDAVLDRMQALDDEMDSLRNILTSLEGIGKVIEEDKILASLDIGEATGLHKKATETGDEAKALRSVLANIEDLEEDHGEAENALAELEEEFHDLMPEECPLCGQGV
jgi:exonuclease SbcC